MYELLDDTKPELAGIQNRSSSNSWWARSSTRTKLLLGGFIATIAVVLGLGLGIGLMREASISNDLKGRNPHHHHSQSSAPATAAATTVSTPSNPSMTQASATSALATPLTSATPGNIWQPAVASTWQIVLDSPISLDSTATTTIPDVDVFDIDLFDNPKSTIDQLHTLGKKVICYFSAGTYEQWRPDAGNFTATDKGSEVDGWAGEYWLDINSDNVRTIMTKRIQLASQKGCDGVDPDNVNAYVRIYSR
jgi:hypothetical protein